MDLDALVLSVATHDDVWIVDSGASCHDTYQKEILHNYVKGDFGGKCISEMMNLVPLLGRKKYRLA